MLYSFQVYSNVNQLYIHTYPVFFRFFSHRSHYRLLSSIPCYLQWHPTPVLLPGKSHGRRSLVGCSPWGRKESDSTERLHLWTLSLTIPFLPPHPSPVAQAHPFLFPHFARPAPHTCHLDYNISCCLAAGGLASSLAPPAGFATMTACCVKHGDEKQARTMQGQYAKVNSFYTLGMNSPYNESKTFPLTIASKRIKQTNLTDV